MGSGCEASEGMYGFAGPISTGSVVFNVEFELVCCLQMQQKCEHHACCVHYINLDCHKATGKHVPQTSDTKSLSLYILESDSLGYCSCGDRLAEQHLYTKPNGVAVSNSLSVGSAHNSSSHIFQMASTPAFMHSSSLRQTASMLQLDCHGEHTGQHKHPLTWEDHI